MKIIRILLIVLICVITGIAALIYAAPVLIHHVVLKQIAIALLEDNINRRSNVVVARIGDYRTDILSFTDIHKITVFVPSKPKLTIDKISFDYDIFDLNNGLISGMIDYGTVRVKFDILLKKKLAVITTNWMDSEELNLKLLRKFFRGMSGNVNVHGKLRLRAAVRFSGKTPLIDGRLEFKDIDIEQKDYSLKVESLNGFIPFCEDFDRAVKTRADPGILYAENVAYKKLHFTNVRGVILYDDYGVIFSRITCVFMKSSTKGKGKLWAEGDKIGYKMHGVFYNIDFNDLDEIINHPDYGVTGSGNGSIVLEGVGSKLKECFIKVGAIGSGGTIRAAVLRKILDYLPASDIKDKVGVVLQNKRDFVYKKGFLTFEKNNGKYEAALYLDGDHLLDFKFNIDEELIDDIIQL